MRKSQILGPDEGFFEVHSGATDREKDKIWAQKRYLQRIMET
ncbi:hypothetical protein [Flagellimonas ruestringensis]|nr:hypothetical protein [Allomuricauda ruestringensis]